MAATKDVRQGGQRVGKRLHPRDRQGQGRDEVLGRQLTGSATADYVTGTGAEANPWLAQPSWDEALEQLRELRHAVEQRPAAERAAWAQTAAQGVAVLYGWAQLAREHAPTLRALGRELAASSAVDGR